MHLDTNILVPLAGVILGWVLSSFSGALKIRGENKRLLGKSITSLYYIISELDIVMTTLDKMKNRFEGEEYERMRQKIIERHTLKNENSYENINQLIDNISGITPSLGIDLKHTLEGYMAERKIQFNSSSKRKGLYLITLSMYEVHQDFIINQMKKLLIKLAFKHSISLGFKIRNTVKKESKWLKQQGTQLCDKTFKMYDNEIDTQNNAL